MSGIRESDIEFELMQSGTNRIESISDNSIAYNEYAENDPKHPIPNKLSLNASDLPTAVKKTKLADTTDKSSVDKNTYKFELKPRFNEKVLKKLLMDSIVR